MGTIIESLSMAILLILVVLLILHALNGDALAWLTSKFQISDSTA